MYSLIKSLVAPPQHLAQPTDNAATDDRMAGAAGNKKIDLEKWVPVPYIKMVFDCTIQIITAMDFAHSHKLIHGQLDLSKIKISKGPMDLQDEAEGYAIPKDDPYYNLEFEITDFSPVGSMLMPLEPEASYWPFSKNKDPKKTNLR